MTRRFSLGVAAALVGALASTAVFAQDAATAEILFREGKRLMDAKDYAQACPKLSESYRIDPATGTLLALAVCHQSEGKLASAWTEYQEVVARAQKEGSAGRAQAAGSRADALEARVSRLAVTVNSESAKVPGLEVKRDGTVMGAAAWGLSVPVDGGEHVVEASAPGRKSWTMKVKVGSESDKKVVDIPVLEEAGGAVATPAAPVEPTKTEPVAAPSQPEAPKPVTRKSVLPIVGWTGVGVGGAVIVTSGIVALAAKSSYSDAMQHCGSSIGASSDTLCDPGYTAQRNSAVSQASAATWLFAGGAVVAATGVVLIVTAPRQRAEAPQAALEIVPGGLLLKGEF